MLLQTYGHDKESETNNMTRSLCIIKAVARQWTIFTIILALFLKVAGDYNFNPVAFKFETCT